MGKLPLEIKKYFEWLRKHECAVCHKGTWDDQLGEWHNTISHVLKRGSTRRNDHFNCVVPMCGPCHSIYEKESPERRERFRNLAIRFTDTFQGEISRKKMWELVKDLQK